MKNIFTAVLMLLLFSCKQSNEKKVTQKSDFETNADCTTPEKKNDLKTVEGIRAEYAVIQNELKLKKLDSAAVKFECEERSGTAIYYSEKGVLKLLKFDSGDSHFTSVEEYYVAEGKPFFIFVTETGWSFDGGTSEKPETKDDITEKRFYLNNNSTFECFEKKYTIFSAKKDNPKSENVPNKKLSKCDVSEYLKNFEKLKSQNKKQTIGCF
ncbi:hypothetical protein ASG01_02030 [Chryseobacterium sp. Leaf180]|uniref:hypothetical protein n=1 Tax=Chryseobacterium sp. Leaf180 TaxID=1736289 RepID=UPI0006FC9A0A|nr:hypothetical protein [Chryseobacterium sp. Leaf180]KQR94677.1 hypothetical protein ASG01_02030 [Chryseobacterium sp. Leaf180]